MKTRAMLTVIMVLITALFVIVGCKVHKQVHKSRSSVDSTASRSRNFVNTTNIHQQGRDSLRYASFANSQSGYLRHTVAYNFLPYSVDSFDYGEDSAGSSLLAGVPPALRKRVTSMTVTTERGEQAKQAGEVKHRDSEWLNDAKDSLSRETKQDVKLEKSQSSKDKEVKRSGGNWMWWLSGFLLVAGWGFLEWKGWGIARLIRFIKRSKSRERLTPLEIAIGEVGNQEIPRGKNWGKHVEKYLKSVGLNFPAPWCMAFIFWCVQQSCRQRGIKNPLFKTGGVAKQWQESKGLRVDTPQAGDIFVIVNKDGTGHCGFVERVDGEYIYTIEGNSNDDGSNEGYEVVRHRRKISEVTGFIRVGIE